MSKKIFNFFAMMSFCVEAQILPNKTSNTTAVSICHIEEYHILECLLMNRIHYGQVLGIMQYECLGVYFQEIYRCWWNICSGLESKAFYGNEFEHYFIKKSKEMKLWDKIFRSYHLLLVWLDLPGFVATLTWCRQSDSNQPSVVLTGET